MERATQAADSDSGDGDDERLFERCPVLAPLIGPLARDDPAVTTLELYTGEGMDARSWRRLGRVLGRNTQVVKLGIGAWDADVAGLCDAGLKNNRCVRRLWFGGIDFRDERKMAALAPFLRRNPSLRTLSFFGCNVDAGGIGVLADALLRRPRGTLLEFSLTVSDLGDIDLDNLVRALGKSKNLTKLWLTDNRIGLNGCASLAKLLEDRRVRLGSLYLDANLVDDRSAIVLANSLSENTALKSLNLHGNAEIGSAGWSALRRLVCDNSSVRGAMESNHALRDLGMQLFARDREAVDRALGVEDADLLRAALEVNRSGRETFAARCKVFWGHARGNFNIGDASIAVGAVPRILAWIGDANELVASPMQHRDPPLPEAKVNSIRLDVFYRIVLSRPDLFMLGDDMVCQDERVGVKRVQDDVLGFRYQREYVVCFILFGVVLSILWMQVDAVLRFMSWGP